MCIRDSQTTELGAVVCRLSNVKVTVTYAADLLDLLGPGTVAEELRARYPDMPVYPAEEEGKIKLAAGWMIDRAGMKGCLLYTSMRPTPCRPLWPGV